MYTVHIRNLIVEGVHGVTHKERQCSQSFQLMLTAEVGTPQSGTDSIEEAVDYRNMKREAERIVREEQFSLLETLAQRIGEAILEKEPGIASICVTIEKLEIWPNGIPGVVIKTAR